MAGILQWARGLANARSGQNRQPDPRYPQNSYNGGGEYRPMTEEQVINEDYAWGGMTPEQKMEWAMKNQQDRVGYVNQYIAENPQANPLMQAPQEQVYPQQTAGVNMANNIQNQVAPSGINPGSTMQQITGFQQQQGINPQAMGVGTVGKVLKPNPKVSVQDYLTSQGQDGSYSARKVLAKQMGIENYTGTAEQNKQLLEKLQSIPQGTQTTPFASNNVNPY